MHEQVDLNEHHRRRLLVSCQYVDRLLSNIESAIADRTASAFPKYIQDMNEKERREAREQAANLRAQLLEFLQRWGIAAPAPAISARHSVLTSLSYIDIAVEELKPRYMAGYGPVPAALVPELASSVEDLQQAVKSTIATIKRAGRNGVDVAETKE